MINDAKHLFVLTISLASFMKYLFTSFVFFFFLNLGYSSFYSTIRVLYTFFLYVHKCCNFKKYVLNKVQYWTQWWGWNSLFILCLGECIQYCTTKYAISSKFFGTWLVIFRKLPLFLAFWVLIIIGFWILANVFSSSIERIIVFSFIL